MYTNLLLFGVPSIFLILGLFQRFFSRQFKILENAPCDDQEPSTSISIVISAKDEEETIAKSVASLLELVRPRMEIIVVNDRSSDNTGKILQEFHHPQLKVITIEELPPGWLGKCHGLHQGALQASNDFLLFSDGDVLFSSGAIPSALSYAQHHSLDHLALLPKLDTKGWWESLVTYVSFYLGAGMLFPKWIANPKKKNIYMGVGAFNMIRRELWQSFGGHEALRLEILDDVMLGRLVKAHGGRSHLLDGRNLIRVRWQKGVWGWICGVEKNSFAALNYSSLRTLGTLSVLTIGYIAPLFIGLSISSPAAYLWLGLFLFEHIQLSEFLKRQKMPQNLAFGLMPAIAIFCFAAVRSMVLCLKNGGVKWRDTFYTLKELRDFRRADS